MPRKSAAALSVAARTHQRHTLRPRQDAPAEVRTIFLELVASVPADHFRQGDGALLEQYWQSILLARKAYAELDAGGPVIDGKASPWLVVLEKSHRSAVALSGRLRLAPQARADSRSAGRSKGEPPSTYDLMRNENAE